MSINSGLKTQYWWVIASNKKESKRPWHWESFFEEYEDKNDFDFGGPDWIRSKVSFARINEMRKEDIAVAYQAGEGIVGLAYLACDGYQYETDGNFDSFDLRPTPFVYLSDPVPYSSIRDTANASKYIEFIATKVKQGTVFRIDEKGFEIILREILQFNPLLDSKIRDFLSHSGAISEAKIVALDNSDSLKLTHQAIATFKRTIRDSVASNELKKLYRFKCQICGDTIEAPHGKRYAEVHHLKPVGKPHNGKDGKPNMLVLCPQHHAMFDLGIMAINPKTMLIEHWNDKAPEHGIKLILNHNLDKDCLKYQYTEIFTKIVG